MSTTPWTDPNNPENKYDIGYEGVEHAIEKDTVLGFIANTVRVLYPYAKIPAALAIGLLDWDGDSTVPTYGLWAVPADSVMFGLLPKRYTFERPLKAFCFIIEGLWPSR